MGQLAPITLKNGSTSVIFQPVGIDTKGVAKLVNGTGVLIADKTLSVSARRTSTRRKVVVKLTLPVLADESVNGVVSPKQVRQAYVAVEFDFSVFSETSERTDAIKLAAAALADTSISDLVINNGSFY